MRAYKQIMLLIFVLFAPPCLAEVGQDELKRIEVDSKAQQRKFDVDANIKITNVKCLDLLQGRVCVGRYVYGIAFTVLATSNKLLAMQLSISMASVENPKDVGRAMNAFFIGTGAAKDQKQIDALAAAGAICVADSVKERLVLGPLSFEKTGSGCVIEFQYN